MQVLEGRWAGRALGGGGNAMAEDGRAAAFALIGADCAGLRVLDLAAGHGAFGFEALSRGAGFCLFVETDEAARGAIRKSIEAFGAFGITRVHRRAAEDLGVKPAGLGARFNLCFARTPAALDQARDGAWLSAQAITILITSEGARAA